MHPAIRLTRLRTQTPATEARLGLAPRIKLLIRSQTRPPAQLQSKLDYWLAHLPTGHVLACVVTGDPISDNFQLNPAGCENVDVFRGPNAPVIVVHGRTAKGARPIGHCVDLFHERGRLYAVARIHTGPTPPAWSVGWLPVDSNPRHGYVEKFWIYELTTTPMPLDKNAVTIKSAIAA